MFSPLPPSSGSHMTEAPVLSAKSWTARVSSLSTGDCWWIPLQPAGTPLWWVWRVWKQRMLGEWLHSTLDLYSEQSVSHWCRFPPSHPLSPTLPLPTSHLPTLTYTSSFTHLPTLPLPPPGQKSDYSLVTEHATADSCLLGYKNVYNLTKSSSM